MSKQRKTYTREFKLEAIRLAEGVAHLITWNGRTFSCEPKQGSDLLLIMTLARRVLHKCGYPPD